MSQVFQMVSKHRKIKYENKAILQTKKKKKKKKKREKTKLKLYKPTKKLNTLSHNKAQFIRKGQPSLSKTYNISNP